MNKLPNILVVSNNSFSQSGSNGRTIANMFRGWPKECIAQFFISTDKPDFDVCDNYYPITDLHAFKSFKSFKKARRLPIDDAMNTQDHTTLSEGGKKVFKTSFKSLCRQIIWWHRWNTAEFWDWVDSFNPDVVFVMNSDATFILDIGRIVSERRKIPLVMFNTEGYYLFKRDFMRQSSFLDKLCFPIYKKWYNFSYESFMKRVDHVIYCNSKLEEDYKKIFNHSSSVFYTSSELSFDASFKNYDTPVFSYLGNFGYDRPDAIIEIAETLTSLDPTYMLDVYGKFPNEHIRQQFESCPCVRIKGFVDYTKVKEVIYNSTILFHAEVQTKKFADALRYGFTTKVADSISSGHCFLMYSSTDVAGAKYLIDTQAGWYAGDLDTLKAQIVDILHNPAHRVAVLANAKSVAQTNHNVEKNKQRFMDLITDIIENYKK